MTRVTRIILIVIVSSVSGCIYVPPVWDAADEIDQLGFLKPGVTSRADVIATLGEPDTVDEGIDGSVFTYRGEKTEVAAILIPPIPLHKSKSWWVRIEFDENDVVRAASTSEGIVFPSYAPASETVLRRQWHSLCRQAVAGNSQAGSALASHYRHGWQPVEKDLGKAFLWYSFAAERGYPRAGDYRKKLESEMSSEELSQARTLVKEWEPAPADCELEAAQADN